MPRLQARPFSRSALPKGRAYFISHTIYDKNAIGLGRNQCRYGVLLYTYDIVYAMSLKGEEEITARWLRRGKSCRGWHLP